MGLLAVVILLTTAAIVHAAEQSPLLTAMKTELDRSVKAFGNADSVPMYFLSYQVTDTDRRSISASYGAITGDDASRDRILDIDCRVGDYKMDNTREIRGGNMYDFGGDDYSSPRLPLEDDAKAIRTTIWDATDRKYKAAIEQYTKVKTNQQVMVEQEDTAADFSIEKPNVFVGALATPTIADPETWKKRLRELSAIFKDYPFVERSSLAMSLTDDNRYFVSSEGSLIQTGQSYARLSINCAGVASDGMRISRYEGFDAASPDGLPPDSVVVKSINRLVKELDALLKAPLAQPYTGPAILVNRAAGVYLHEIFGHRIEGHRQKSETEGQTFAKKVGEPILPDFMSIYDDPTLTDFNGKFLRGHYLYDDEGVKTSPVTIVDKGVLKGFLMSRSPVKNFPVSNAHGRKQAGTQVVARQGNLMARSSNEYSFDKLVDMLKEECRKQGKPYGLIFYDISGGFTMTGRYGPQAFKVIPLLVYRCYTDDRPLEAIRGVDIVGTPLASFSKIIATGNDYDIFNGTCGAESGWVPVSAISPSILISEMEVEKKFKEQEKPPLLPPPYKPAKTIEANHGEAN
jgi:predicted Zn-dependent protease